MADTDTQPTLRKARVRGSGSIHYVIEGNYLSLCARVTDGPPRPQQRPDYCRRCTIEASRLGCTTRP